MRIHLHRAITDNTGRFVDAGVDVGVGTAPDQIDNKRAAELLASHGALEVDPPVKAAGKPKRNPKPKGPKKAAVAAAPIPYGPADEAPATPNSDPAPEAAVE